MDEYEAARVRVEKISTAVQSIKESLTCIICLELFDTPVTIKCGHKFCRECILRVTNNENSSCPFCNTKIQKRSIPKYGNDILQESVKQYENLIKAIEADSGIDIFEVLQCVNKAKNTKESLAEYSKPNTSKVEDTPSTSKGSSAIINQKSIKGKIANPVRNRLSLTKKKSPSPSLKSNTLHKFFPNKPAVPEHVVEPDEKVKSWLEKCSPDDNDNVAKEPIAGSSKNFKDNAISTPLHEVCYSPQNNKIKESKASLAPLSESSSETKYKEVQKRIEEAEMMARKKKLNFNSTDNSNVKTPSSIPATSCTDAGNWRRVKQVGREMQVKTFKTLNVSIERYSTSVAVEDTVIYDSTNNDSKHVSHDLEANNTSNNNTPLQTKKYHPVKSENNNLKENSPQNIIEDYKHRSMDSTDSPKKDCTTSFKVDDEQLHEIIGIVPSTSISKTPEETKTLLKTVKRSILQSKLNESSPSKKSNPGPLLSDDESSKYDSKLTVIDLQNSPPRKSRLSLKTLKSSTSSKNSSTAGVPEETNKMEKALPSNIAADKFNSKLLRGTWYDKNSSSIPKITAAKPQLTDNITNKHLPSVSRGCRIIFQKLGKICKKKKNVPFRYLGKLERENCVFYNFNPCKKPAIVMKSNIPICIDYKRLRDDTNIANLEDFNELQSEAVLQMGNVLSNPEIKPPSADNNYEEAMNVDKEVYVQNPGQSNEEMEIDETLPPAKMTVKADCSLEKRNFRNNIVLENVENTSIKSSKIQSKSFENEDLKIVSPEIEESAPEPFINTNEDNISTISERENEVQKCDSIKKSSSKIHKTKNSSDSRDVKSSTVQKIQPMTEVDRILDDLVSISSDDSEAIIPRTSSLRQLGKAKFNELRRKNFIKSDVESCTESEVSVPSRKQSGKIIEDKKHRYSSTSSSSMITSTKKKRTHSESSNDDGDVVNIINKWVKKPKTSLDDEEDQSTKIVKVTTDSEEMINRNASRLRQRSRYSLSSSSEDEQEIVQEEKHRQNISVGEAAPKLKSQNTEINVNNIAAMPSSLLSADLFESHEQSIQPAQSVKRPSNEIVNKNISAADSDAQSDKENKSERSRQNITVIDTRELKKRKSFASRSSDKETKGNKDFNETSNFNKSNKSIEEQADEVESSQKKRKSISIVSKVSDSRKKETGEYGQAPGCNTSITATEEHVDEVESSQKDKNKIVDNVENESEPFYVRDSLLNITQEQLACKNIEKELFGIDLSKVHENQNEEPLEINNFTTPRRKPTISEENDDLDSDNIAATPVVKRRHTIRFPSSQSSQSETNISSNMPSPIKRTSLIPAITPMKNRKSYPLSHSTPMITMDSSGIQTSQTENIKLVYSSLTADNVRLIQTFAERFNAQIQANFDMEVTHVVVKVDPETKSGPKTFKYIQGIAFKKHVVSFQWIVDCLARNTLVAADDDKYDVLDPDIFESGCKKSRLSSQKLFKNFAFCCLEPFVKVTLTEFEELLAYNGGTIVSSIRELQLHKDKLRIIIVGTENLTDDDTVILSKVEAAAVFFEWVVDSLSQFQILSLPSYLCETTVEKVVDLGFPPELLIEEETMEEYEDDN